MSFLGYRAIIDGLINHVMPGHSVLCSPDELC